LKFLCHLYLSLFFFQKLRIDNNKGPQYEKVGELTLTTDDVSEIAKPHDIQIKEKCEVVELPLYDNIVCRLAAQPKCITDNIQFGFLNYYELIGGCPSWSYLWCELKAGCLKAWKNPEEKSSKKPYFTINVVSKDIITQKIEKSRQKRPYSFKICDNADCHLFATIDQQETEKWIRSIKQQRIDFHAWSCASQVDTTSGVRVPMFIGSPRNKINEMKINSLINKSYTYNQLNIASPTKSIVAIVQNKNELRNQKSKDELKEISHKIINENEAPWTSLFNGALSSATPIKISCKTNEDEPNVSKTSMRNTSAKPPLPRLPANYKLKAMKPTKTAFLKKKSLRPPVELLNSYKQDNDSCPSHLVSCSRKEVASVTINENRYSHYTPSKLTFKKFRQLNSPRKSSEKANHSPQQFNTTSSFRRLDRVERKF